MSSASEKPKVVKRPADRIFSGATVIAGSLILAALAAVAIFLLAQSLPALVVDPTTLKGHPATFWNYVAPLAFGTLWSAFLALLFAVPLSFVNPRSGRSWNLIFAVLIYVVYNNTLSIFQAWTSSGRIPTWAGLWPVHLAMVLVVIALFARQMGGFRWAALVR